MTNGILNKLLNQKTIVIFCRLPASVLGESDGISRHIRIDLKKRTDPARAFLHELLHFYFPELSETAISAKERRLWKKMTKYERWLIYRRLFAMNWREE